MQKQFRYGDSKCWKAVGWAVSAGLIGLFGAFALVAGAGLVEVEKVRAAPFAFAVHAFSGGLVLLAGSFQFNRAIRTKHLRIHRTIGVTYVVGVLAASISGFVTALHFDVSNAAKLSFMVLATLWLGTTLVAVGQILRSDVARHREWMLRSFALSLFFVSFSFWVPTLAQSALPERTAFSIAVTVSWVLNLAVAELWIRTTRFKRSQLGPT